jgi:hypothetical protein
MPTSERDRLKELERGLTQTKRFAGEPGAIHYACQRTDMVGSLTLNAPLTGR